MKQEGGFNEICQEGMFRQHDSVTSVKLVNDKRMAANDFLPCSASLMKTSEQMSEVLIKKNN